ncbi:conserved hypothetical protein (plasmid) [Borreliella burgdorferi CA-11.2A]|nr:conserved hypothetical protein [Borreliella burgdorferi 156a]ACN24081.1 conserved hypothetical protein [Borreliella burgdorferi 64b]ACN55492.1 conserved hypothetical protein [Borreliella burgdorferi WI91-23]ACN56237.1 conserved hypothetical protein [Borreliella burgdorferi CA-11.2A]
MPSLTFFVVTFFDLSLHFLQVLKRYLLAISYLFDNHLQNF